jgi:N4-gp56 family major capsid protein
MAIQNYSTQAGRLNKVRGEILAHAVPVEVLGITGQNKKMPKNSGDNIVFRRWMPALPTGATSVDNQIVTVNNLGTFASSHLTSDGVTPTADSLTATDVTATLQQYSCLYAITDKTFDLYEDDVAGEMKRQVGERMGAVREMIRYGELRGQTNVVTYCGGSAKNQVDEAVTLNVLRKTARTLLANHAKQITSILAPSASFATAPVEAGFLVFCHTDMEPVIRDLPGFKHVSEYGQRKVINEYEVGSVERFRFVLSPELVAEKDQGAAIGATGLFSTTGSNIDTYPLIVVAEDAWGDVALRGGESFDVSYIPVGQKDKNDPLGQRGYIGAKFYSAAKVLNNGWMAVIWSGTPTL